MAISFVGKYNTGRKRLRMFPFLSSFDIAVGGKLERDELGIITRQGIMISGLTNVGKTTIATSIAARLANQLGSDITFARIDTFDEQTFEDILTANKFDGKVSLVLEDSDEETVDMLWSDYNRDKENYGVAVLDSIWAVSPVAEQEGQSGDRNVASRANLINPWAAKMHHATIKAKNEKVWICTNHRLQTIGGQFTGDYVPGGRKVGGMTSLHIKISQAYMKKAAVTFPQGRLLAGKVTKNNFGRPDTEFSLFVRGGYGIHDGMTALYDCISLGYAHIDRSVILDGEKQKGIKYYLENLEDDSVFTPYYDFLNQKKDEILGGLVGKKAAKKEVEAVEEDWETPLGAGISVDDLIGG